MGPENDLVRLGASYVIKNILLVAGSDNSLEKNMLISEPIVDLVSACMRSISSIAKIPGQAAYMAHDGMISCIAKVLKLYSNLPPPKSKKLFGGV